MSIRIVCDSLSDILPQAAELNDIRVVPLLIQMNGKWVPETSISKDEFWEAARAGNMPATSQPPVGAFSEVFQELVSQGHEVICLTMTAVHSGTFNSASVAAQEFGGRVHVLDSRSLSYAEALQAELAAQLAAQGCTVKEIILTLKDLQSRLHVRMGFEKLEWGRRGGRLALVLPMVDRLATTLRVRPMASVTDGVIKFAGIARSGKGVLSKLRNELLQLGELEMLMVVHARRPQQAMAFRDALLAELPPLENGIPVLEAGPGLVSHTGEGLLAVCAVPVIAEAKRPRIWERLVQQGKA